MSGSHHRRSVVPSGPLVSLIARLDLGHPTVALLGGWSSLDALRQQIHRNRICRWRADQFAIAVGTMPQQIWGSAWWAGTELDPGRELIVVTNHRAVMA